MKKAVIHIMVFLLVLSDIYALDKISQDDGERLSISIPSYWPQYEMQQLYLNKKNPVWSPDGKWIAFIGFDFSTIFVVPSHGGEAVLIYENRDDSNSKYHSIIKELCFTPDSRKIVFTLYVDDTKLGGRIIQENEITRYSNFIPFIYSINIYSGEFHELVSGGFNPSWSHDGRYLAYINFDKYSWVVSAPIENNGAPAIYDIITGETRYLNNYRINDVSGLHGDFNSNIYKCPVISPDNKFVYLSDFSSGKNQIARIPFNGGETEFLTCFCDMVNKCEDLSVSPDGRWICFSDSLKLLLHDITSAKTYDFITAKEYTQKDSEDSTDSVKSVFSPCWSPDGAKICYNIYYSGETEVETAIYIIDFNPEKYLNGTAVESEKPSGFGISGNFPNPFNPSTTISFSLPFEGKINFEIYDSSGRKVRGLISGYAGPGTHSVIWDGRDDNGKFVSTGLYISKLEFKDKFSVKKMLLIK